MLECKGSVGRRVVVMESDLHFKKYHSEVKFKIPLGIIGEGKVLFIYFLVHLG